MFQNTKARLNHSCKILKETKNGRCFPKKQYPIMLLENQGLFFSLSYYESTSIININNSYSLCITYGYKDIQQPVEDL